MLESDDGGTLQGDWPGLRASRDQGGIAVLTQHSIHGQMI